MAWKAEVIADSSGKWVSNALRFATREEAENYVWILAWRWTSVRDTRVAEVREVVTAAWTPGGVKHLDPMDIHLT